jgi:tetratricopeptide (TPR) repeat protein
MTKIALNMIVGGYEEPAALERVFKSVGNQVDAAFVTITSPTKDNGLKKVCKKYNARADYEPDKFYAVITKDIIKWLKKFGLSAQSEAGDKIFLFDKARNYNLAQTSKKYEWILWIDVDDVLRGNRLRDTVKWAEQEKLDSVFVNYIYQAEIVDGKIKNIIIEHLRERLFRNADLHKWEACIHETLIEQKPTKKGESRWFDVLHLSNDQRTKKALLRNIKNLEYSIYQTKGKDPRPIYYLGKAYYDAWLTTKKKEFLRSCKVLFEAYLSGDNKSGWAEERSQCWEYLTEVHRVEGQLNSAIKCAHNALIEDDRFPSAYINMALCYTVKKEWDRALHWIKLATNVESPRSTLVSTPRDLQARALEIIYHSTLQTGKIDEAWASAQKLQELLPDNKEMANRVVFANNLVAQRNLTKGVIELVKHLEQTGQEGKIKPLILSLPELIANNPYMAELSKRVNPPRVWEGNEVAIYCGPCFTPWSPNSLARPGAGFVGGSEEAVIYLSKELCNLGWKVTVYADPGAEEGDYGGVKYLPYFKFNPKDSFNILVGWRRPDFVDGNYNTKKMYIWCHDILNQLEFTKERLEKITKIMVLSPWHRENIPDIPDNKVLITSNGINI